MLFSELYALQLTAGDDWFDPIIDHDTRVFIDPFLIFRRGTQGFSEAHSDIVAFFRRAFELAARSGGNTQSLQFRKLQDMLLFPEIDEMRIGYAKEGHGGAGTATGFAKLMVGAIMESIARGMHDFKHFEELGIFHAGISSDRISDIAANILKPRLMSYTQDICARHGVPMQRFRQRLGFDLTSNRWEDGFVELPVNSATGEGIILVPRVFLRMDPTIAKDGFKEFLWEAKGETLRNDLNYELKSQLDGKEIIRLALEHPGWVDEYVERMENEADPVPYDLGRDTHGVYKWHKISKGFVASNPFTVSVRSDADFLGFVKVLAEKFRFWIEESGGWRVVWDGEKPLSEEAIQLCFYGIMRHYCEANNIQMSREVETGRGPVDFHFSSGFARRALLEAKLAKTSRFWNNLLKQLPAYMKASGIVKGHYLILCYSDADVKNRVPRVKAVLKKVESQTGYEIEATIVDARNGRTSASKL